MTFTDLLNNPETREVVEALEDVISSLSSYPNGDATLEAMRDAMIKDLHDCTGFTYQI